MDDETRELKARYAGFFADQLRLEAKLNELDIERDEVLKKLASTRKIVGELAVMCGFASEERLSAMGFTDACRAVLKKAYPEWLSAKEIKERLELGGFDLSRYDNPSASIYTILSRLEPNFAEKQQDGFKVLYRWKRKLFRQRRGNPVMQQT